MNTTVETKNKAEVLIMSEIKMSFENMSVSGIISAVMESAGIGRSAVAEAIQVSTSTINDKFRLNRFSADEFCQILGLCGYYIKPEKKTGAQEVKLQQWRAGKCPPFRQMVKGTVYDTTKADALCCTVENCYWMMELYKTAENRFFVAHFNPAEEDLYFITPVSKDAAKRLYEANTGESYGPFETPT